MKKVITTKRGYHQKIWTDPETGKLRREYVHRLVWEEHHGAIPEGFHVHHKDGDKQNNNIENLELLADSSHAKHHTEQDARAPWTWGRRKRR
jgi:hypothetical protein